VSDAPAIGVPRRPAFAAGRLVVPVAIAALVVLVDQLTKYVVADWLGRGEARHRWELLDSIVAFEYVENPGAAFGLFRGGGGVVAALGAVMVVALTVYYLRVDRPSLVLSVSLGLLIGGGIGNVVDRVRLGYVIDFAAIGVWPKFNVADSAVTVGVLLLVWHALLADHRGRDGDGGARGEDR
jgi:signal peptidase II